MWEILDMEEKIKLSELNEKQLLQFSKAANERLEEIRKEKEKKRSGRPHTYS